MDDTYKLFPFPENLVRDVYKDSEHIEEILQNPAVKLSVFRAIRDFLPDNKELRVKCTMAILDRYGCGATLTEIGEHLGVGRARAHDILAKGLRCLRYPALLYVFNGQFASLSDYIKARDEKIEKEGNARVMLTTEDFLGKTIKEVQDMPNVKAVPRWFRLLNVLKRAYGMGTTMREIYYKDPETLLRVYGFGKHSLEELDKLFKIVKISYLGKYDVTRR